MKSEAEFYQTLETERLHVLSYEDPEAQEEARKVVPIEDLEVKAKEKFEALKSSADSKVDPAMERDLLLLELLNWFKSDFFSWVNQPECDKCKGKTESKGYVPPIPQEQADLSLIHI